MDPKVENTALENANRDENLEQKTSEEVLRSNLDTNAFRAVYRHRTIRNYKVDKFEFKDGKLVIDSAEDDEAFRTLVGKLPPVYQNEFVVVDEEATAASERPLTIRGATGSKDILTEQDKARLREQQSDAADANNKGTQLNPPSTGAGQPFQPKS